LSIEIIDDMYVPICDYCGTQLKAAHKFKDAITAKKDARWCTYKNNYNVWIDYCPECQNSKPFYK